MLRGNRNLQLLFGGQVVSSFGDWLYVLALAVLVYDLTGSATVVAALTFVRLLPYALFLPFAGVLADRANRKAIMIGADLGRGACMLGLLFVGSARTVWVAFPLVFGATVLSSLPHRALDDLASCMELQKIPEGTDIVREGDVGDRLYILKEGEAEVVARAEGEREVEVATLSKNDYFGEIALLRDVPRTATVRSRGPVELYSLGRDDFWELLERSEELKSAMTGTSDVRYVETQNSLLLRR